MSLFHSGQLMEEIIQLTTSTTKDKKPRVTRLHYVRFSYAQIPSNA